MTGSPPLRPALARMPRNTAARCWAATPIARQAHFRFRSLRSARYRAARWYDAPARRPATSFLSAARSVTPRSASPYGATRRPPSRSMPTPVTTCSPVIRCPSRAPRLPTCCDRTLRRRSTFPTALRPTSPSSAGHPASRRASRSTTFHCQTAPGPCVTRTRRCWARSSPAGVTMRSSPP